MKTAELVEMVKKGLIDTHRFEDALTIVSYDLEHADKREELYKAWEFDDCWVFQHGQHGVSKKLNGLRYLQLEKGEIVSHLTSSDPYPPDLSGAIRQIDIE